MEVETSELAKDVTAREASAKAGDELDVSTEGNKPDHLSDEELRMDALRILREAGVEEPSDEELNDLVGQLKAKAAELDPVTGDGGNHPVLPPTDGIPAPTGFNEAQAEQADEHELDADPGPDGEHTDEHGKKKRKRH